MVDDEKSEAAAPNRRQFLVHIDADLIRRVKILAIEEGVSASSLVQDAIVDLLSRRRPPGTEN